MPTLSGSDKQRLKYGDDKNTTYGREDVGEEREIFFMLSARRQFQSVEVGEGDSDVFGLATLVRAHGDITVRAMRRINLCENMLRKIQLTKLTLQPNVGLGVS